MEIILNLNSCFNNTKGAPFFTFRFRLKNNAQGTGALSFFAPAMFIFLHKVIRKKDRADGPTLSFFNGCLFLMAVGL